MNNAIVVVSRGRAELLQRRGLTLAALSAVQAHPVMLALREDDVTEYVEVLQHNPAVGVLPLSNSCDNWGKALDAVIRHPALERYEKICICDDDLTFAYREWGSPRLHTMPPEMMDEAFKELFSALYMNAVHASFRHRAFAQNCTKRWDHNKRGMWTHAVDRQKVIDADLHFAWKGIVMGDFYFQLSAIRKGFTTVVVNSYTVDDVIGPYKSSGGCNLYRTAQMRSQAARWLREEFPEAITLREKRIPDGRRYTDVTMYLDKVRQLYV